MTVNFYEYGNSVIFNKRDIAMSRSEWEEEIKVGDTVLYHDSVHGTRPHGHVVAISTHREYLLVRLAGYEMFILLKKFPPRDYIVLKSDIKTMLESTGKKYYEGTAKLQNVYWEPDPEGGEHMIFVWYLTDERRLHTDIVNLEDYNNYSSKSEEGELVDHISGRYDLSE